MDLSALESCFPSRSLTNVYYINPSVPFIITIIIIIIIIIIFALYIVLDVAALQFVVCVGRGCIAVVDRSISVVSLTI